MKRSMKVGMAVLTMTTWLATTALAQASPAGAKTNLSSEKGKAGNSSTVSLLDQAEQLVSYARENESPVAMLTAVQMIRRVPLQDASAAGAKKSEAAKSGEEAKEGKKTDAPAPSLDTKALLAEAKGWAKGDEHVMALLDAEAAKPAESGGTLGSTQGAISHTDTVVAGHADLYTITFRAGEIARVGVVGDGSTDLDLYVYDENGNLIASDTDATDRCLVEFTPKWTGAFRVRIVNNGMVYNQYVLLTN